MRRHPWLYAVLVVFGIWWLGSILLQLPILPSPIRVLAFIFSRKGLVMGSHLFSSVRRLILGVVSGLAIGYPLGLILGTYPRTHHVFSPILALLYPIPKTTFLPLFMLAFGLGDAPKIGLILLIIVFPIIIMTRDQVMQLDSELFTPLIALGASETQIFRELVIPATIPQLLSTTRISTATALSVLFLAEAFGTRSGIGFFIMDAMQRINYVQMFAGIVILACLGVLCFQGIDWIEKKWNQKL
ncbi:ABC transporter permease [Gottschalkiaceae bacterium SANA]|nr:ABC transporter permease [Gottschalkiaceae bacterium SANA]